MGYPLPPYHAIAIHRQNGRKYTLLAVLVEGKDLSGSGRPIQCAGPAGLALTYVNLPRVSLSLRSLEPSEWEMTRSEEGPDIEVYFARFFAGFPVKLEAPVEGERAERCDEAHPRPYPNT
jgi:hypothetical protein